MGEYILLILLFILVAILVMMGITMLYHFLSAIIPMIALFTIIGGMVFGLVIAIRNTIRAHHITFGK